MKVSAARDIESFLKHHEEEMIIFLKKLVTNESPSHDPESQTEILQILKNAFESLDFYTFIVPGRKTGGFLYARPKQHKHRPIQLMIGHCDTVWKKNTLEEMPILDSEDRLSGPGIFDMKAGLSSNDLCDKGAKGFTQVGICSGNSY